jgi:hypothetical protein
MNEKIAAEPSQGRLLSCFCLELKIVHDLQSWPHPLNCVRACVRLLFEGSYYFFRRAPDAATIQGRLLIGVRLLNMVDVHVLSTRTHKASHMQATMQRVMQEMRWTSLCHPYNRIVQ